MAYDLELAERIRERIGTDPDVAEKKMFGGLAFLVNGNMSIAASGQGGILARVDPDRSDELMQKTGAQLMEMRGRTMAGWLRVGQDHELSSDELAEWVEITVAYARSLPPKK